MSEWREYRLDEIGQVVGGGTPSSKVNAYWNGDVGWVTPADLSGYQFKHIGNGSRDITELGLKKSSAKLHPKNTVLMTSRAPIGYLAIADKPVATNQGFQSIRCNEDIADFNFIYYLLGAYKEGIALIASGATFPEVSGGKVRQYKIKLPPLPTQQKIAKILSNYDDLIENNLKRIKLLEESARLTYEEWFLRFRVDGKRLEINPESGLPFGWENKSVTECDTFKQDKRKVKEFEGEKKYYATANISETEIIADGEIISWDSKPSRAQIKPNNNTVWFARMSNTYKVLCFNKKNINLQDNSVLSSGFAGFKAKNDLCLPFLYFTINSTFFHELKDLYATGATQVSLNNDSMSFIKIIEPSANLAEEFGSRTLPLIEEISILRSKNQLLKEARNILLPRLMTNVIDTDELDIAV